MTKEALSGTHLDWDRELCKQGCKEWIPWYKNRHGKTVKGCRIGAIPEGSNGQWHCRYLEYRLSSGAGRIPDSQPSVWIPPDLRR